MTARTLIAAALALLPALTAGPALALCELCSAEIRLDPGLADCLVQMSGGFLKQMDGTGKPFVIVDLNDCGNRGGLPTGAKSDGPRPVLDTRFVIDEVSLKCLLAAIEGLDDAALAPSHVFNLKSGCPAS